jgi:hypothetical protein
LREEEIDQEVGAQREATLDLLTENMRETDTHPLQGGVDIQRVTSDREGKREK